MGRPRKVKPEESTMDTAIATAEKAKVPIEDMELTTMRDYRIYNEEARKLNKKLKICRYPIKQCPVELHPTERVIFSRVDQPTNPLPVYLSDEKIHFEKTLVPGQQYDLPKYIVHFLQSKGKAIWKWFDNPDGSRETRIADTVPRFSLKTVYKDYE